MPSDRPVTFRTWQRRGSLVLLAACVAASLVFRRFVFVAWYPVLVSAGLALSFGLSLLGKPLCLALAEEMPPHLLPEGAERYCRRLTVLWCCLFVENALVATVTVFAPRWTWVAWNCCLSYLQTALFFGAEWLYRRRRFVRTFHTSGSSGTPKTIVKPFAVLAREVDFHRRRLAALWTEKPLFVATVETSHMYGCLWVELLARAAGCPRHPGVVASPEELAAAMASAGRTFLVTTPSFLARLGAYAAEYAFPKNAVAVVTSGALLTAETSAAAARMFGVVPREIFGSTETGGVAERRQTSPDCDWEVFGPVKASATADGRLEVRSPFSVPRRYALGDGVALAPDGRTFRLLGRRDRLVKIAEERVSLVEMEAKLKSLPGVTDAALCVLDGRRGPILGAVLAGTPRDALEMRRLCRPLFPRGTVPRRFRFVDRLPYNAQGKLAQSSLAQLLEAPATSVSLCVHSRLKTA